jgi:hypothetical protein
MGDSLSLSLLSFPSLSLLPDFLTKTGEAVDVPATVGRAVGRRTKSDGFVEFLLVALAIVFLPACPCLSSIFLFYPQSMPPTSSPPKTDKQKKRNKFSQANKQPCQANKPTRRINLNIIIIHS